MTTSKNKKNLIGVDNIDLILSMQTHLIAKFSLRPRVLEEMYGLLLSFSNDIEKKIAKHPIPCRVEGITM